jgi:hypothetical protein
MQKKMDKELISQMMVRKIRIKSLPEPCYSAKLLPDKGIHVGVLPYGFPLMQ